MRQREYELLIRQLNIIAEVRQGWYSATILRDTRIIALFNFLVVQVLPGRSHVGRKIHDRAPDSRTTSGVKHVIVHVGVWSLRHQTADMLANRHLVAERYQNVVLLHLIRNRTVDLKVIQGINSGACVMNANTVVRSRAALTCV